MKEFLFLGVEFTIDFCNGIGFLVGTSLFDRLLYNSLSSSRYIIRDDLSAMGLIVAYPNVDPTQIPT